MRAWHLVQLTSLTGFRHPLFLSTRGKPTLMWDAGQEEKGPLSVGIFSMTDGPLRALHEAKHPKATS